VRHFGLDPVEFEHRHQSVVGAWESGRITLDEYLDHTVFCAPRAFTREEYARFMLDRSTPQADALAIARAAAATGRYRLMTLNNESEALNVHRLTLFGLVDIFDAFFSSCWLGVAKPAVRAYTLALAFAQARPAASVFIDDREENLEPARALGMHTIHFTTAPELRASLGALGVTL
jgi:putative hydrolase of the HAD superfamily